MKKILIQLCCASYLLMMTPLTFAAKYVWCPVKKDGSVMTSKCTDKRDDCEYKIDTMDSEVKKKKETEKKSDPSKPNKKKAKEEEPRPVCEMKPRN